jgi:Domain of unknown function (DUF4177)
VQPAEYVRASTAYVETMPTTWEYRTEMLTSMVGRDKIRMGDLAGCLKKHGAEGWELASFTADADVRGERDGHLLIFKRPTEPN